MGLELALGAGVGLGVLRGDADAFAVEDGLDDARAEGDAVALVLGVAPGDAVVLGLPPGVTDGLVLGTGGGVTVLGPEITRPS